MAIAVSYQEAKQAFVELYGNSTFNQEFESFDEAFKAAWNSFDYISNAETLEQFAEGMCECWQLQESL